MQSNVIRLEKNCFIPSHFFPQKIVAFQIKFHLHILCDKIALFSFDAHHIFMFNIYIHIEYTFDYNNILFNV